MMINIRIKIILTVVVLALIICGLFYFSRNTKSPQIVGGDADIHGCIGSAGYSWCEAKTSCIRPWESFCTSAIAKTVTFKCDTSKTIVATFYPTDDKFVDLKLSDSRNMTIPHAISASGARYAKSDESFVFWNKGDTAFITEGESGAETYSNCKLSTTEKPSDISGLE